MNVFVGSVGQGRSGGVPGKVEDSGKGLYKVWHLPTSSGWTFFMPDIPLNESGVHMLGGGTCVLFHVQPWTHAVRHAIVIAGSFMLVLQAMRNSDLACALR